MDARTACTEESAHHDWSGPAALVIYTIPTGCQTWTPGDRGTGCARAARGTTTSPRRWSTSSARSGLCCTRVSLPPAVPRRDFPARDSPRSRIRRLRLCARPSGPTRDAPVTADGVVDGEPVTCTGGEHSSLSTCSLLEKHGDAVVGPAPTNCTPPRRADVDLRLRARGTPRRPEPTTSGSACRALGAVWRGEGRERPVYRLVLSRGLRAARSASLRATRNTSRPGHLQPGLHGSALAANPDIARQARELGGWRFTPT